MNAVLAFCLSLSTGTAENYQEHPAFGITTVVVVDENVFPNVLSLLCNYRLTRAEIVIDSLVFFRSTASENSVSSSASLQVVL
jgi:hypothetical protein